MPESSNPSFPLTSRLLTGLSLAILFAGCKPQRDSPAPAPRPPEPDEQPTTNVEPSIDHLRVEWNTRGEEVPWEAAITLAEMSNVAYTDPDERREVLREMDFDEVVPLDSGPMSGFVAMTDNVAVIAFRGTDMWSLDDWLTNVDFRDPVSLDEGREVHRGFQLAYERLADDIDTHLRQGELQYIWMTGHSLGGAMATCCAYDWEVDGRPFTGLVTFGQPRVGNEKMAQFLEIRIGRRYMRFINEDDLVPILPPNFGPILPDYWHLGARIRFKDENLDRLTGVTPYMAPALGSEAASEPSPVPNSVRGDREESISEDDFLALQEYLKARQAAHVASQRPEGVPGNALSRAIEADLAVPADATTSESEVRGTFSPAIRALLGRLNDHSMEKYVRRLNSFRRNKETE